MRDKKNLKETKMTARQITRKLKAAGILPLYENSLKIEKDEIEVCVDYKELDNNGNKYGVCNEEKTQDLANKVKEIIGWDSYQTQYDSVIFEKDYNPIDSDWNDVSSEYHY